MTVVASTQEPLPRPVKSRSRRAQSLLSAEILVPALGDSFKKPAPRWQARNPVMFVVLIGAVMTTYAFVSGIFSADHNNNGGGQLFVFQIALWLWFTVLFANLAEAVAEGRGKAQAETLRRTRTDTIAKLLANQKARIYSNKPAHLLSRGDLVLVEAGYIIPSDGEIIEGVASVDESAITGE